jgi:diguanylate cyclase (GGDEF)-like protein
MSGPTGSSGYPGVEGFAQLWLRALRRACYVPLPLPEYTATVTSLAERLAVAVYAEPFDPSVGHWVGADLVVAGFVAPEVLGSTLTLLHTRLADALGRTDGTAQRVTVLAEEVATGFTAALRDRILDAHDEFRMATLTARVREQERVRAAEARFQYAAAHDPLTGLPNRTQFTDRLAHLVTAARPGARVGVCCIDIDKFHTLTDCLGHHIGDQLIALVASRLRELAAVTGCTVARLDRDEFAILLDATTCAEDAVKVADRALTVLSEPYHVDGAELPVTASAGVVEREAHGAQPDDLIRAAEVALHWARADGQDRYRLYEPGRATGDAARYRLSAAMPAGLRRREFTLNYQPLVDLADGRMVGVEALVRWRHPEKGLLGAQQFIGLAHDTGLIVALGGQLLALACRQAAEWQELERPPYVSVNLSARQLQYPGLLGDVAQILDRSGLSPRLLQIEVTEHAVVDADGTGIQVLRELAGLGVRIALDDFGTGYANLASLRTLPLHEVKLDRSLLHSEGSDGPARHTEFLETVVSLGHTLGLKVTAEGVETAAQAQRLRVAGCDTGQGWYFGRPVPAGEITRRWE